MSKTTESKLTKSYSGIFGNQVLLKNRRGKSVMTIPPQKTPKPLTEKMDKWRKYFKQAAVYAKDSMQDPEKLAAYTAKARNGMAPHVVALTDYLCPPYVDEVDVSGYRGNPGDKICVAAYDDFRIVSVGVQIADPAGNVLEEGDCVYNISSGRYDFTVTVAVPKLRGVTITATAHDLPAHTGKLSVTL